MKNKYISQTISKKFKNRHRGNALHTKSLQIWDKYKECHGTKKGLKRQKMHHSKYCSCSIQYKEKKIIKVVRTKQYHVHCEGYTQVINYKITKKMRLSQKASHYKKCGHVTDGYHRQCYEYQDLYNALQACTPFVDSEQQSPNNIRDIFVSVKYSDLLQTNILCLKEGTSTLSAINQSKRQISKNSGFASNLFAGNIYAERDKKYGFIVIDDIDINKQYYWNKKVYFTQSDGNVYYGGLNGGERVMFELGFAGGGKISPIQSNDTVTYNLKAINLRLPNQDYNIGTEKARLLISGYVSIFLNRMTNTFLPIDIQNVLVWFYRQYHDKEQHWMRSFHACDDYFIDGRYILSNREISSAHNVIIAKDGIKYEDSVTEIFNIQVLQTKGDAFKVGIMTDPNDANVNKYLKNVDRSNRYYWRNNDYVDHQNSICEFDLYQWWWSNDGLSVRKGDVIEMSLCFGMSQSRWTLHLHKNGVLIETKHLYFVSKGDIYYPYVTFNQKHLVAIEFCGSLRNNVDILTMFKHGNS